MTKSIEQEIMSDFGKGILSSGQSIVDSTQQVIPVSPGLDLALGGGIPEGSFVILTGPPKVGKAQDLNSIIYTKDGPKRMGDIEIGDILCHPKCGYTTVTNIFPQGLTQAYKVIFSDGSHVVCCEDHLWKVKTRFTDWKILSTKQIRQSGLRLSDRYKWMIPLTEPVSFPEQKVDLDPYIMGLLLGDGSFRNKVSFTTIDKQLFNALSKSLPEEYKLTPSNITYNIVQKKPSWKSKNLYVSIIKKYGLYDCSSHTKFIPKQYLYNSVENRLKLLQGLMDTDGSSSKNGSCEYSTVSLQLAKDVKILTESLGHICIITPRYTTCNEKKFKSFRVKMLSNNNGNFFQLNRKIDRCHKRTKLPLKRRIIDIIKLPKKVPMQCISVSSSDGLYLTNNFVVTHNTSLSLDFAGTAQQIKYACELGRKEGRHVYYSSVEGRLKRRDLQGIKHLNIDEDRFSIIQSQPGNILTAESFIDINERLINQRPGDIFIIDSFSALCSAGERNSNIGDRYRADVPVLLAKFCRRVSNVIAINKSIVIGITHIIANQGGGMSQWSEASGRKIQYQTDVKLKATHCTPWVVKENQIGQDVHWVCVTTALQTPPGRKFSSKFRYNYGVDKEAELVDLATDIGIISKAGAWYTLPDGDEKYQGKENLIVYLKDNNEVYEKINKQVKDLMGL